MSHHSSEPNHAMSEAMRKLMGEYPNGRLNENDAGAIAMSCGVESGRVVLRFPKPVAWIGMTPDEAMGMAEMLVKHARAAGSDKQLALRIG